MKLKGNERCVYCGLFAEVLDHWIPWSFDHASDHGRNHERLDCVPACKECNAVAGDKVFENLELKRDFLQGELARRYKKLLEMPDWNQDELREVSAGLRKNIILNLEARELMKDRLRWPYNYYSLYGFSDRVFKRLFER